jgi:hypothetical protein
LLVQWQGLEGSLQFGPAARERVAGLDVAQLDLDAPKPHTTHPQNRRLRQSVLKKKFGEGPY